MRIGFMLPGTFAVANPYNGVREQAYRQADALARLGVDVLLLNPWEKYAFEEFDIVQFFSGGAAFWGVERRTPHPIRNLVLATIIDSPVSNVAYRAASRLGLVCPKVYTIPGMLRAQAKRCACVITRSSQEKSRLVVGLGIPKNKVVVVLNGVSSNSSADPSLARDRFGIDGDFVLHVSRYTNESKNVINMIRGIGEIGLPLVIAGTSSPGFLLDEIQTEAERFNTVSIIGQVTNEERDSLYAACRVFCLPSLFEGTGLVALEAASHGAEIVITRNGGPPDYFLDFAHYTRAGTPREIGQATLKAWDRRRYACLQPHVNENLTWESSARGLISVYERVLAAGQ